jgi:hypothetical protein
MTNENHLDRVALALRAGFTWFRNSDTYFDTTSEIQVSILVHRARTIRYHNPRTSIHYISSSTKPSVNVSWYINNSTEILN